MRVSPVSPYTLYSSPGLSCAYALYMGVRVDAHTRTLAERTRIVTRARARAVPVVHGPRHGVVPAAGAARAAAVAVRGGGGVSHIENHFGASIWSSTNVGRMTYDSHTRCLSHTDVGRPHTLRRRSAHRSKRRLRPAPLGASYHMLGSVVRGEMAMSRSGSLLRMAAM